jgi:hypothetical protein
MTWTALYRPLHVHAQATLSQINTSQFPVLDMLGGVSLSDPYGHTGTVYLFIQECTIVGFVLRSIDLCILLASPIAPLL